MDDIKFTTAGDMVGFESRLKVTASIDFVLHRGLIGNGINEAHIIECIREALEDRITGVSEPNRSNVTSIKVTSF